MRFFRKVEKDIIALCLYPDVCFEACLTQPADQATIRMTGFSEYRPTVGELETMCIFNPTRIAAFIDSIVKKRSGSQLRISINGPSLIEHATQSNNDNHAEILNLKKKSKNIVWQEAEFNHAKNNQQFIYFCAVHQAILFQCQLLARRCACNLTCVTSGTWARLSALKKAAIDLDPATLNACCASLSSMEKLCSGLPLSCNPRYLAELVGLALVGE